MAFRWASIVQGEKKTPEEYEINRKMKAEQEARERALRPVVRSVEQGSEYRLPPQIPGETMFTPKGVNYRAADFAEMMVWNIQDECLACTTVGQLKIVFAEYYTDYIRQKFQGKYMSAYMQWQLGLPEEARILTLSNIADWVAAYETESATPWHNIMFLFCKNVTFDSCLWALSISGTFRTGYTSIMLDEDGHFKSGFLSVHKRVEQGDNAVITWLTDINTYVSTRRVKRD